MDQEKEAPKIARREFLILSADLFKCASVMLSAFSIIQSWETRDITNSYHEIVDIIGVPPEQRTEAVRKANEDQKRLIERLKGASVSNAVGYIGFALTCAGMSSILHSRSLPRV